MTTRSKKHNFIVPGFLVHPRISTLSLFTKTAALQPMTVIGSTHLEPFTLHKNSNINTSNNLRAALQNMPSLHRSHPVLHASSPHFPLEKTATSTPSNDFRAAPRHMTLRHSSYTVSQRVPASSLTSKKTRPLSASSRLGTTYPYGPHSWNRTISALPSSVSSKKHVRTAVLQSTTSIASQPSVLTSPLELSSNMNETATRDNT